MSIEETMRAMEKLVDEGKVNHIGVSNFSLRHLKEAEEALSRHRVDSNQVEYGLKVRSMEADLLPYCERNNIAIIAYRPVAHGAIASPGERLKSIISEVSRKHGGKTPSQIALNWILSRSRVTFPIPRASRESRVIENFGSMDWRLDDEDLLKLEAAV